MPKLLSFWRSQSDNPMFLNLFELGTFKMKFSQLVTRKF